MIQYEQELKLLNLLKMKLQGLQTLAECLKEPAKDILLLTAETISNVCKLRKARRAMRRSDGISRLVRQVNPNTTLTWQHKYFTHS